MADTAVAEGEGVAEARVRAAAARARAAARTEVAAAVAACWRAPAAETAVAEGSGVAEARARAAAVRARAEAAEASTRVAAMKVARADVMGVQVVKVVEREEVVMEAVREAVKEAAAMGPQIPVTRGVSLSCFRPRCRVLCSATSH